MPSGGASYEIRIKGRLSDSLLAAFEGLTATAVWSGPGPVHAVYSLLDRISRWAWNWSRSGGSSITRRACGRTKPP